MSRAYEAVIEFIARGTTPAGVIAWQPSPAAQARVAALIADEEAGRLSPEGAVELNHVMELEHIMRLAKANARRWV